LKYALGGKANTNYKDLSEIHSGLGMIHYEHHYVFYLSRPKKATLIIAIFHEKMNLMTRIKQRLILP